MELLGSYCEISETEIKKLCEQLGCKLPKDYMEFLLAHNGGQPKHNHFIKAGGQDEDEFDFDLNVFYGIGGDDTSYDILTMFEIYSDRIPSQLLPIGDDGIGNVICLGIDGNYFGKVYIWWADGQVDEDEEPNFDNVDLIEDTFGEFLKGFKNI